MGYAFARNGVTGVVRLRQGGERFKLPMIDVLSAKMWMPLLKPAMFRPTIAELSALNLITECSN